MKDIQFVNEALPSITNPLADFLEDYTRAVNRKDFGRSFASIPALESHHEVIGAFRSQEARGLLAWLNDLNCAYQHKAIDYTSGIDAGEEASNSLQRMTDLIVVIGRLMWLAIREELNYYKHDCEIVARKEEDEVTLYVVKTPDPGSQLSKAIDRLFGR